MKHKTKKILAASFVAILITIQASAGSIRGVRASAPVKDNSGNVVETTMTSPYEEFDILDEDIFSQDQLSEIPGRIVAIVEDKNQKLLYLPYADEILRDSVGVPEVKPADFKYDYFLLDVQSAAQLGVGISGVGLDASASSNYRVEYTFYQGAISKIGNRDIDQKKFNLAIPKISKDLENSGYKIRGYRVVMAAVTLHSAYALLTGVDARADVSGLGWKVGGKFYASQKMEKNRIKVGLTLRRIAPDTTIASVTPTQDVDIRKLLEAAGKSSSTAVEHVEPGSLKLDKSRFPSAFNIQGIKIDDK